MKWGYYSHYVKLDCVNNPPLPNLSGLLHFPVDSFDIVNESAGKPTPLGDSVTQPDRGSAIVWLHHQAHMAFSVCVTKTDWRTALNFSLPQAAGDIFHWPEGITGVTPRARRAGKYGRTNGTLGITIPSTIPVLYSYSSERKS